MALLSTKKNYYKEEAVLKALHVHQFPANYGLSTN